MPRRPRRLSPSARRDAFALAYAFAEGLKECLTAEQWAEMQRRNAAHGSDSGVCASHDFLDANDVMAEAFEIVMGRDVFSGGEGEHIAEADRLLWNAAWDDAKRRFLTAPAS